MASEATSPPATASGDGRDRYVDFIRAFSLLVVVAWHWVFTIIIWEDDGPHASNPIGFTDGMWLATWLFQVLPLFFYVGGYSHLRAWRRHRDRGEQIWSFVGGRVRGLAVPSAALLAFWLLFGAVLSVVFNARWVGNAVLLVISPLWFVAVYLVLILLLPLALWLHERLDSIVLVLLAGVAGAVDILRFREGYGELGIINMVAVWGLCHQLGFFYERIVAARRTVDWTMLLGGLFGLAGLVGSGLYPGSMVGVPGERSNMAPPTLCIVALLFFQAGLAEILRPTVDQRLVRPRWSRVNDVINRFALPLFLFHTTGMAISRAVNYALNGGTNEASEPSLGWWLYRPLAFIGPLIFTIPVIWLFGRQRVKRPAGGQEAGAVNPSTRMM